MTISIHGSRVGPDFYKSNIICIFIYFNPRVPCGTRQRGSGKTSTYRHFNPRVPCGTRLRLCECRKAVSLISIHGSRVGPDFGLTVLEFTSKYFNPRVPCGTRPAPPEPEQPPKIISIHGSRVGPDLSLPLLRDRRGISIHGSRVGPDLVNGLEDGEDDYFNPRVPCGTRLSRATICSTA